MMWSLLSAFVFASVVWNVSAKTPQPCSSRIYCYGPLLRTVQMARLYNDSKTFVDMKMKNTDTETLINFERFMLETQDKPTPEQVQQFVDENFEPGNELEKWEPWDYVRTPKFLNCIKDGVVRDFAKLLIERWPELTRRIKKEVIKNPKQYSIIPVPNAFVIPGGRFREYYYWDTYFIIKGLLVSEMGDTARGMIDNLMYLVKIYGFVPNGGRIYFLNRSQPPLLTKMALAYYKYAKDRRWLKQSIQYLDTELRFWLNNKTVAIKKDDKIYRLAHYSSQVDGPRPEAYYEDTTMAEFRPDEESKHELYANLKGAAESGWDFSSRWFFDDKGGNMANLSRVEPVRVLPVDLNSYLCQSFNSISYLYSELNDLENATYWRKIGILWQKAIDDVLWNEEEGIWFDYDTKLSQPRKYFYVSNVAPLWTGCFDRHKAKLLGKRVMKYLNDVAAFETPGGIATSFVHSGEQWDFPNCWPPLQAILIQGLKRTGEPSAVEQAELLVDKWIRANIEGFRYSGEMYEKYDALRPGKFGGGGEYVVQSGFGWSNGVALELVNEFFCGDEGNELN